MNRISATISQWRLLELHKGGGTLKISLKIQLVSCERIVQAAALISMLVQWGSEI